MQAAVLEATGERLRIEEVERADPSVGEVALEVTACGVCHTDLHVLKGEVVFPLPCVPGHEVSGTVIEVGREVRDLDVGDTVVCSFVMPCGWCRHCVRGATDLCETFFSHNRLRGTLYDGTSRLKRSDGSSLAMYSMAGFASEVVVPASAAFRLPEEIDPTSACILGCSVLTAFGAVRNAAQLLAGETVAVVAVGGVGLNIVALANAFGARRVIAVDVDAEKLEKARTLGATDVVNSRTDNPIDAVRDLTGGGADVAFEALGRPETFELAVSIVGDGGRAVMVGIAPHGQVADVDITRVVRRKIQIRGSYGGRPGADMPGILDLVARGVIDPSAIVSRTYALEDVATAFDDLDRGDIVGRAVVRP